MTEPLTLALVGTTVVTEGIKFLYGQATDAIKRWREHGNAAKATSSAEPPPRIFEGTLAPLQIHLEQVGFLESHLLALRRTLSNYAEGLQPVGTGDAILLETVDALRQAMEAVYQQRLTFVGEQRAPSGPLVEGTIDVQTVAGIAAAVEARLVSAGRVSGHAKGGHVESGGEFYGVKADRIGGNN